MWITPEHEPAAVRALLKEWHHSNWDLFNEQMDPPTLRLSDVTSTLGRWHADVREIELSRPFVTTKPWLETVEVLRHEMAHQYVAEVLGVEEPPHGPVFQEVCRSRSIDGRASGDVQVPVEQTGIMRRIAKLLALAGSANQNEAEVAMTKAQTLMRVHNLERIESQSPSSYSFLQLGAPASRVHAHFRWIACILRDHFFVQVIWISGVFVPGAKKTGAVLEASGTPENLAIAEYVYAFLTDTAARLWEKHKKEQGIRSNKERLRYFNGVMQGFNEKLKNTTYPSESPQTAKLIRVGDLALRNYYESRHPHIRKVSRGGGKKSEAFHAGKEAGKKIVLHKPVNSAGDGQGRLLGPGRR